MSKHKIRPKLPKNERLASALVRTTGRLFKSKNSDEALSNLLLDAQANELYDDGKTLVDLVPRMSISTIQKEYLLARSDQNFDLRDFMSRHFYTFTPKNEVEFVTQPGVPVSTHMQMLWSTLKRHHPQTKGSLIGLPYPYIVPGGRFDEQYYWDSYFIMLGLAQAGKWDEIESMVKNCAYMIRRFGFVPTANRTYFLSRSQPPVFSLMVRLLASHKGRKKVLVEYMPYLVKEYSFWMKGRSKLTRQEHRAFARIVQLPSGDYLNRYYDNARTPRAESLREDTQTANSAKRDQQRLYLHLRAGAESGWDFSSRWFLESTDISTIHTADILPVDLNSLLYLLEQTIAEGYLYLHNEKKSKQFRVAAERRAAIIRLQFWNETTNYFEDINFHHGMHTGKLSLAGVFPLYARLASKNQADAVARRLKEEFLKPGGLITTLEQTGQQWDAPNGWAPLQYIVIVGLRNYGHYGLADEIRRRWTKTCLKVYTNHHKLVEKYNVIEVNKMAGGGEYPLQDGFGWTNGVLAVLLSEDEALR